MTALQTYTTVNSSTEMTVVMSAVSHVIDNKGKDTDLDSCWIHFHSGKSVHVRTSFDEVTEDLEEFYKTHG